MAVTALLVLGANSSFAEDVRRVSSGETLWKIASESKFEGHSTGQTVIAIFQGNPSAFNYSNINSLRARARLILPEYEDVEAITTHQALNIIALHNEEWREGIKTPRNSRPIAPIKSDAADLAPKLNSNPKKTSKSDVAMEIAELKSEILEAINDITASQNVLEKNIVSSDSSASPSNLNNIKSRVQQ
ncbi:MAG: hypothetical protein PSN44_07420 [Gammaproteobacteria bacterium]|nr:hypothetical protein [Gammaproteobacteria bacterium]